MNDYSLSLASTLVGKNYVSQSKQAKNSIEKLIQTLLSQKKLPSHGWSNSCINYFLNELSIMDSNNFISNIGIGEREARIYSDLVRQRNYSFGHGIGRSGDIAAVQPKAAGSSLLYKITQFLVMDLIHLSGIPLTKSCLIFPLATGMTISLVLLTLFHQRPHAKYIIWPRIDQKSCFKSLLLCGLQVLVIDNIIVGDEISTNIPAIHNVIQSHTPSEILCIVSTSSCFSPRAPDKIMEISQICKEQNIPHIINNAYGLQSQETCQLINQAMKNGRVDAFISSTDKNFLVPVGGAIVSGPNHEFISSIGQLYPGRASIAPMIDLFITLLTMGVEGWKKLCQERYELFHYFKEQLRNFSTKYGERVLETSHNPISIGMTLDNLTSGDSDSTYLGSMLFSRQVSGVRTVILGNNKSIDNYHFQNYGAHISDYHTSYMNMACSIGLHKEDIDEFMIRLDKCFQKYLKQKKNSIEEKDI